MGVRLGVSEKRIESELENHHLRVSSTVFEVPFHPLLTLPSCRDLHAILKSSVS